eukprot:UN07158
MFNPITNANFIDKKSINKVFKAFYHIKSCIYYAGNHLIISISKLSFYEKLLVSWDIHRTGKGNGARKKWKTGKCRICVVHYGRDINTCVISRFQCTNKT